MNGLSLSVVETTMPKPILFGEWQLPYQPGSVYSIGTSVCLPVHSADMTARVQSEKETFHGCSWDQSTQLKGFFRDRRTPQRLRL